MPYYRCELAANLTAESALARIQAAVGPPPTFRQLIQRGLGRGPATSPPFIGKVEGDRFRVRRDIWYRNDFRPVITGRIMSEPTGVRIRVVMFLQPATAVFMLVWFSVIGIGAALSALTLLRTARDAHPWSLAPVGMLIFGAVLVTGGFYSEALRARRLLEQVLAGSDSTSS